MDTPFPVPELHPHPTNRHPGASQRGCPSEQAGAHFGEEAPRPRCWQWSRGGADVRPLQRQRHRARDGLSTAWPCSGPRLPQAEGLGGRRRCQAAPATRSRAGLALGPQRSSASTLLLDPCCHFRHAHLGRARVTWNTAPARVFVSWGRGDKWPQTGWLKTTAVCCLTVLEARLGQGEPLLEALREALREGQAYASLPASGGHQHLDCVTPISACVFP